MSELNPEHVQELTTFISRSPFPGHLGMELVSFAAGRATVRLPVRDFHFQPYGIVHGGVLSSLIDTATFWAVYTGIPDDAGLVSLDLKLNYLEAVEGGILLAEGRAIRQGKGICYAEARVVDENNRLIVHGTSTLKVMPGWGLKTQAPKFMPSN